MLSKHKHLSLFFIVLLVLSVSFCVALISTVKAVNPSFLHAQTNYSGCTVSLKDTTTGVGTSIGISETETSWTATDNVQLFAYAGSGATFEYWQASNGTIVSYTQNPTYNLQDSFQVAGYWATFSMYAVFTGSSLAPVYQAVFFGLNYDTVTIQDLTTGTFNTSVSTIESGNIPEAILSFNSGDSLQFIETVNSLNTLNYINVAYGEVNENFNTNNVIVDDVTSACYVTAEGTGISPTYMAYMYGLPYDSVSITDETTGLSNATTYISNDAVPIVSLVFNYGDNLLFTETVASQNALSYLNVQYGTYNNNFVSYSVVTSGAPKENIYVTAYGTWQVPTGTSIFNFHISQTDEAIGIFVSCILGMCALFYLGKSNNIPWAFALGFALALVICNIIGVLGILVYPIDILSGLIVICILFLSRGRGHE